MAFANNNIASSQSVVERILATAAQMLETAAERQAQRRIYRTTLSELRALSNRELADLGLHRSQLRQISWDAAQQHRAR